MKDKDIMDYGIYPLIIIADSYGAPSSRYKWAAFNYFHWDLPRPICVEDSAEEIQKRKEFLENVHKKIGRGDTVQEAIDSLKKSLEKSRGNIINFNGLRRA